MARQYSKRLQLAMEHVRERGVDVVFCLMGPPWVVKAFGWILSGGYYFRQKHFAIIGYDWRDFGHLPVSESGHYYQDLDQSETRFSIRARQREGLSFDPTQYPRRHKKRNNPKQPKQKSNRPGYTSPTHDEAIPWKRDPNDR